MSPKRLFAWIILCVCVHLQLSAIQYGLFSKYESEVPITHFFVIGERCSGTNYIYSLINDNFPITEKHLGHKHFPPWYDLNEDQFAGKSSYYDFKETDHFVFIIIFRNPYDWLRSLHKKPWHADKKLLNLPFSNFIRTQWNLNENDHQVIVQRAHNPLVDMNPHSALPFDNVLKLRSAKIKNMLMIRHRAKNVYYVNYETARDFPEEVVKEIDETFNIVRHYPFSQVIYKKGKKKNGVFVPKVYEPLSPTDLLYINEQLNSKLEKKIGYPLRALDKMH